MHMPQDHQGKIACGILLAMKRHGLFPHATADMERTDILPVLTMHVTTHIQVQHWTSLGRSRMRQR